MSATQQKIQTCPICLDNISNMFTTKCGHQFCTECITQYAGDHGTCKCPMCRKHVIVKTNVTHHKIYKYIKKYFNNRKKNKIFSSLIKKGYELKEIEKVFQADFNISFI